MGKLSLSVSCTAMSLAIATSADARGGTYHHSEPYAVHYDRHPTHAWAPVIVYSAKHHHYHLTYHPDSDQVTPFVLLGGHFSGPRRFSDLQIGRWPYWAAIGGGTMSESRVEHFKSLAAEAERAASKTSRDEVKHDYLYLAQQWRELARQSEILERDQS